MSFKYVQIKTVKTKACIAATPTSKNRRIIKPNKAKMWEKLTKPPKPITNHTKDAHIFNKVCPAIMFAKSRIPKLIGLKKKDINSIGTIKKLNKTETPEGKNDEKTNMYSSLDSRLDKLESKLTNKK